MGRPGAVPREPAAASSSATAARSRSSSATPSSRSSAHRHARGRRRARDAGRARDPRGDRRAHRENPASTCTSGSASTRARRSWHLRPAGRGRGNGRRRRHQHRQPARERGAARRHPRRRGDLPGDGGGDRVPPARAGPGEGQEREPVRAWEVLGSKEDAARAASDAPFVGRRNASCRARGALDAVVRDRRATLATVIGSRDRQEPPGRRAGAPGRARSERLLGPLPRVRRGHHVLAGGRDRKEAAGIAVSDDDRTSSRPSSARCSSGSDRRRGRAAEVAAAFAHLIGAPSDAARHLRGRGITRSELHWGVRRLFELLPERPLVLVFEDLHWAEPTLLELLAFLCERPKGPILVLAKARPELAETGAAIAAPGPRPRRHRDRAHGARRERQRAAARRARSAGRRRLRGRARSGNARRQPALPRGDRCACSRTRAARRRRGGRLRRAAGADEPPVADRLPPRPALGRGEAGRRRTLRSSGTLFWTGAVAHLDGGRRGRRAARRARPPRPRPADAVSNVAGELEWAFKHVAHPRRRVRAAAEARSGRGCTRGAPSGLGPPRRRGALDRDRRLPPRAGAASSRARSATPTPSRPSRRPSTRWRGQPRRPNAARGSARPSASTRAR